MALTPSIVATIFAHNEERRIAACLKSLPLDDPAIGFHVVVNGTTDRTAAIAREVSQGRAKVHEYALGGKSRSWSRFVLDDLPAFVPAHIFVDGDAELAPGSVQALAAALRNNPSANAAAGFPLNGRKAADYRAALIRQRGMFGDLYALSGSFLERMKAAGIRLPDDHIGDDGLLGALAKTDLGREQNWDDRRIVPCPDAGFLCAPASLADPRSWRIQYRRMINYSVRHFQDRIVSDVMRGPGPAALPRTLASFYAEALPRFRPRSALRWWWFDQLALARMRSAEAQAVSADRPTPARTA
jgi:glycosyltransferase involved in cell wall biosynthesis